MNINKEEEKLQREILQLHFDNIDKIRNTEGKFQVDLSAKKTKELNSYNKYQKILKMPHEQNKPQIFEKRKIFPFFTPKTPTKKR